MTSTSIQRPPSHLAHGDLSPESFAALLDEHGYVYMDGVPDDFDHVAFLHTYGPLMPQYDGELIWSIKAEERFDNLYHSLNTKPLRPHTECYEFNDLPPKYLALWCLVPPADSGGQTTLADLYSFLDTLTEEERVTLASREYDFVSSAGVQDMELGRTARHTLVEKRDGRPDVMRFSYNCVVTGDDPFILDIRERVISFFDENFVAVDFETNALLIWNNHRVVHSRTGYTDRNRHLRRVWLAES